MYIYIFIYLFIYLYIYNTESQLTWLVSFLQALQRNEDFVLAAAGNPGIVMVAAVTISMKVAARLPERLRSM